MIGGIAGQDWVMGAAADLDLRETTQEYKDTVCWNEFRHVYNGRSSHITSLSLSKLA